MNVWGLLLTIFGWILVIVVAFVSLLVIAGIVGYLARVLRRLIKGTPEETLLVDLTDETIIELAKKEVDLTEGALDVFGHKTQFVKGAEYALAAKKGLNNVGRN